MSSTIAGHTTSEDVIQVLSPINNCINEETLSNLARKFSETYAHLAKTSTEHFLTTPVTALPSGKERGKFLAIDVGGTNLRVGFIELLGEDENGEAIKPKNGRSSPVPKVLKSQDKSWPIGDHLKMDKAEDLFAWIGDCIAEVVSDALEASSTDPLETPLGDEVLLGITFSFPMMQTRMAEATLLPMGKGFAITSNLNLGNMLLDGYARHLEERTINGHVGHTEQNLANKKRKISKLPRIRVAAITNDTVATYTSLAYSVRSGANSRTAMGLIVGTGTNATVPMKYLALHSAKIEELSKIGSADFDNTVVINTEWSIRGTDAPLSELGIKTKWDLELDKHSSAPGFQPFEYMTSGRYLGEIVRLALVDLLPEFGSAHLPTALGLKDAIDTTYLSTVVAGSDDDSLARSLEEHFPSPESSFWTKPRIHFVRALALAVRQRSSALIAAAVVGLLACVRDLQLDAPEQEVEIHSSVKENGNGTTEASETEELVVAYAGGLIAQYPDFLQDCQRWIDTLVERGSSANRNKKVVLREALDGGVIGAAVLASIGDRVA